jgi:predicted ATPase
MERKKREAAIREITLNKAVFHNEPITPTAVNIFYGRNGVGKTTISRAIKSGEGIKWQDGITDSTYQRLVYNQDFIDQQIHLWDCLFAWPNWSINRSRIDPCSLHT